MFWNETLCVAVLYVYSFVVLFSVQYAVFEIDILYLGGIVPLFAACVFSLPLPKDLAMNISVCYKNNNKHLENSEHKLSMTYLKPIFFYFLW